MIKPVTVLKSTCHCGFVPQSPASQSKGHYLLPQAWGLGEGGDPAPSAGRQATFKTAPVYFILKSAWIFKPLWFSVSSLCKSAVSKACHPALDAGSPITCAFIFRGLRVKPAMTNTLKRAFDTASITAKVQSCTEI
jgi:hypothetical protein